MNEPAAPVFAAVTGAGMPLFGFVLVELVVPLLAGTAVCCATGDALKLVVRSGVTGALLLLLLPVTAVFGSAPADPGSASRRRLIPRVEDSFNPIFVALMRI